MAARVFAAIDLGASGGRVVAGLVERGDVSVRTVHRFPNAPRRDGRHLRWDLTGLFGEVCAGLARLAAEHPGVESIGIDTWGVDYGLLGDDGELLAEPVCYRDQRTQAVIAQVHARVPPEELYRVTGLQFLPFTTLYQLAAERRGPHWTRVRHVVLLPDLVAYWLTGELRTERTNASTTGLVDARSGDWAAPLLEQLDVPAALLPPIEAPGTVRGPVRPELRRRLGLPRTAEVTTVGSHDTASAVVAVPARSRRRFAYASSGTWSLIGVELDAPILSEGARAANFTNEAGVDGRVRFLRNVGGLWLLQESMRTWASRGDAHDLSELLERAAMLPPGGPRVNVDDPAFLAPGDMPARIAAAAAARGERPPASPAEVVRCVCDSLADAYAAAVRQAAEIAGQDVDVLHVVGGGAQNALLCQLAADRSGLPVVAGPVEATALGNVLVQARARGALGGSLEDLRGIVARQPGIRRFEPRGATPQ